jgi:hypothetical protein
LEAGSLEIIGPQTGFLFDTGEHPPVQSLFAIIEREDEIRPSLACEDAARINNETPFLPCYATLRQSPRFAEGFSHLTFDVGVRLEAHCS